MKYCDKQSAFFVCCCSSATIVPIFVAKLYLYYSSAPIASNVLEFLRICFKCPVVEVEILKIVRFHAKRLNTQMEWFGLKNGFRIKGYGQTECGAACTLSRPDDMSTGHVGAPISCNEIKYYSIHNLFFRFLWHLLMQYIIQKAWISARNELPGWRRRPKGGGEFKWVGYKEQNIFVNNVRSFVCMLIDY